MAEAIGVCIGEPGVREFDFVASKRIALGDYVEIFYEGYKVLGFVRSISRINKHIEGVLEPQEIESVKEITSGSSLFKGTVSVLGDPHKNMFIPRIPPEPGTKIYRASSETLKLVFSGDRDKRIKIGHLLTRPEVDVYIDVDSIVSRHLAILAVTGGGKSNTVSVLLEGLLSKNGTVLIFDMHGEYVNFGAEGKVKRIDLVLNPTRLSYHEFRLFANVDDSAYIQDRYLRKAFKKVVEDIENGEVQAGEFWEKLENELANYKANNEFKDDWKSITGVLNKIEDTREFYSELFDPLATPIVEQIEFGCINVIDLSHVDEKIADIVVSHVLRNVLEKRKLFVRYGKGLPFPLLMVLEEAHILASSQINTRSKYWISRIAREGRKFGLGLCLVTQRPKALDSNTLSQANNMIILRLVEPGDQRYVQQASESLSSDLVEQLPSLNVGEALVMGRMIPVPALVKIDLAKFKRSGNDISAIKEWRSFVKEKEKTKKELEEFMSFDETEI